MSFAALNHSGDDEAGDGEEGFDVGVNHRVPVGKVAFVLFFESECESGVIDEDVNVVPIGGQVTNLLFRLLSVAHVEDEEERLCSVLFSEVIRKLLEGFLTACVEDESVAVLGEFACACHSYS